MRKIYSVFLFFGILGFAQSATTTAPADARPEITPPRLIERHAPVYPAELREEGIVGRATIQLTVDTEGRATEMKVMAASMEEFGRAAKEALAQCKFAPTKRGGVPCPMRLEVPMDFSLSDQEVDEKEARRKAAPLPPGPETVASEGIEQLPELTKEVKPKYPANLLAQLLGGEALIGMIVDENGRPQDVHVVLATKRELAAASMTAIRGWRFEPGKQAGAPVRTALRVIMNFDPDDPEYSGARVRPGVVHFVPAKKKDGQSEESAKGVIRPPRVVSQREPVFTEAMRRIGSSPDVRVNFIVNEFGVVTHVCAEPGPLSCYRVAAERAVSYWKFEPGVKNGRPVRTKMVVPIVFRVYW